MEATMSTTNPLADNAPTDPEDHVLVLLARTGNRKGLEELVQRHQGWIYNTAVRMLYHPEDAEDATQEILLKALTRLSSFRESKQLPHLALPDRRQPRA
jgi:Sigma-70 region 2